jgi:hypothetical protein
MDDYRDLVAAGFALLCAALALVAGLLFVTHRDVQTAPGTIIELPTKGGTTAPLILSESRRLRRLENVAEVARRYPASFSPWPSREVVLLDVENYPR